MLGHFSHVLGTCVPYNGGRWNPTWVPYNMGEMKPWKRGPSCLPKGSWLGWGNGQVDPRSLSGENFGTVTGDTNEKKEKGVTLISLKPGGCLMRAFSSHVSLFPYNCLFCWALASPFPSLLLISRLIHPSPFPFNFSHEVLEYVGKMQRNVWTEWSVLYNVQELWYVLCVSQARACQKLNLQT